jgi:hypothetical protein
MAKPRKAENHMITGKADSKGGGEQFQAAWYLGRPLGTQKFISRRGPW